MTPINAHTTDTQIAVRAAAAYYSDGAPPWLCVRLVNVCRYIDRLPEGNWPETVQAWVQARETFDRLNLATARHIARQVDAMEQQREDARRQQALSIAGGVAKPYQPIIDAIVAAAMKAEEWIDNDEHFVLVIQQAYPEFDRDVAKAISMVCVHCVRRERWSAIAI